MRSLAVISFPGRSETSLPSCRRKHTHRSHIEVDRRRRRRSHIRDQSCAPTDRLTSTSTSARSLATPTGYHLLRTYTSGEIVIIKKKHPEPAWSDRSGLVSSERLAGSGGRRVVLGGKQKNNNKGVAPVRGRTACIVALSEVACSRETADSIELLLSDKEVNKRTTHKETHTHIAADRVNCSAPPRVRSPAWWMAEKLRAVAGKAHRGRMGNKRQPQQNDADISCHSVSFCDTLLVPLCSSYMSVTVCLYSAPFLHTGGEPGGNPGADPLCPSERRL